MVVAIFVVDGQEIQAILLELAATFGADRTVYFQGFRPVVGIAVNSAAHLFDKRCRLFGAR